MEPVIELIDFKEPIDGQISVRDIKWSQDEIALRELLRERLSSYGLIHKILVFNAERAGLWYGYVNFYSPRAANKVYDTFEHIPLVIESHPCKLSKSRNPHKNRKLLLHQCNELANYYLGFNGWNSEILYHRLENSMESEHKYATAVKISFKDFKDHFVEGVGMSVAKFKNIEEKLSEMRVVQKNSKSAALLNAFSKVIIVLVHVGDDKTKVSLEIDHSRTDPFHYNSIWDDDTILEVQELIGEEELTSLFEFEF